MAPLPWEEVLEQIQVLQELQEGQLRRLGDIEKEQVVQARWLGNLGSNVKKAVAANVLVPKAEALGNGHAERCPCALCLKPDTAAPSLHWECGHSLHEGCVQSWVAAYGSKTCPVCPVVAPEETGEQAFDEAEPSSTMDADSKTKTREELVPTSPTSKDNRRASVQVTTHGGHEIAVPEFLLRDRRTAHLFKKEQDPTPPKYKRIALAIASNAWFDRFIGIIIAVNSVLLGVETQEKLQGTVPSWSGQMDILFLVIYIAEMAIRILAYDRTLLGDGWFYFDMSLILTLLLEMAVGGGEDGVLGQIMVVRSLRLLRFVRALRVMKQMKMVWKLVRGLIYSIDVMASTTFLLTLVLFIFACLGLELLGADEDLKNDPETAFVGAAFGSIFEAILTLSRFVVMDAIVDLYAPVIYKKPFLVLYFLPIILVVSISLMNLVTATIVDASLSYSELEREEEREHTRQKVLKSLPSIVKIFDDLDVDKSGTITLEEVENVSTDLLPDFVKKSIKVDSMAELYELLDVDADGEMSLEEFLHGLLELWLMDLPIHTIQLLKMSRLTRSKMAFGFEEVSKQLNKLEGQIEDLLIVREY